MMKRNSCSKRPVAANEFVLALFLIVSVWVIREFLGPGLFSEESTPVESEQAGAIRVYFTAPRYPDAAAYHSGGIDAELAAAIDGAQTSVDVAAFELDLVRVVEALMRASGRGVRVRLVTDSDYADEYGPTALQKVNLPVVFDDRDPFMHNKFVVIDGAEVWSGSLNFTDNGAYRNNNNVVVIQSRKLAENYTVEFEEMFMDQQFGVSSPDDTPYPRLDLDGTLVENVFESEGQVRDRIIELIRGAEESVYFMAFVLTDDEIAKALIDRQRAGVQVRGVLEARNVNSPGSDFGALVKAKVDVLGDGNPYALHHKVIMIDESVVVTGSYNFSRSAADKNDENILIIHNPAVTAQYVAEFEQVYIRAKETE